MDEKNGHTRMAGGLGGGRVRQGRRERKKEFRGKGKSGKGFKKEIQETYEWKISKTKTEDGGGPKT